MAAELKLTKITPTTGNSIDIEGNLVIGTDVAPKALEVKGNLTVGVDIDAIGDLDIGGDIIADNISIRDTPTLDAHLVSKGYLEDVGSTARGYISGLEISNGGVDALHDITIASGTCKDSTNALAITLSSAITKRIGDVWDEGTALGGLDTGTVANSTWYYLFIIHNTSTGTTDALFSLNKIAPTMPSGYTYKRRIRGAVLTNGSAEILGFTQKDNKFRYTTTINDLDSSDLPTSKTNLVTSSPPGMIGIFKITAYDTSTIYVLISKVVDDDFAPTELLNTFEVNASGSTANIVLYLETNASSQISHRADAAGLDMRVNTVGFIDPGTS